MRYIADNLVYDSAAYVMSIELFEDFSDWLKANGHVGWSDQNFSARLSQHSEALTHGVEKKPKVRESKERLLSRRRGVGFNSLDSLKPPPKQFSAWLGIRFRTPDDDPDDTGNQ